MPLTASQIYSLAFACLLNNTSILNGLDEFDRASVLDVIQRLKEIDAIEIGQMNSDLYEAVLEEIKRLNDKASAKLETPSPE